MDVSVELSLFGGSFWSAQLSLRVFLDEKRCKGHLRGVAFGFNCENVL